MVRYEECEAVQTRFQRYDWRLQVIFVGWSVSVAVLIVGVKLLTMNAHVLSSIP